MHPTIMGLQFLAVSKIHIADMVRVVQSEYSCAQMGSGEYAHPSTKSIFTISKVGIEIGRASCRERV